MTLLNTNDDDEVTLQTDASSEMAMSTIRGEMYKERGKNNQDCVASFTFGEWTGDMVCDGLGGYADQNGELAARYFCEEAETLALEFSQKREPREFLKELLQMTVKRYEVEHLGPQAGSTLLLMLTRGSDLTVFHLGDSRAMFFTPEGDLITQTEDHKSNEFINRFKLTKYVFQTDPDELFSQADELHLDLKQYPNGCTAVLMSDGITDNLKTSVDAPECQSTLSQLIRKHQDISSLCAEIMKTANERMALNGTPEGEHLDVKPDNSACLVRRFRLGKS